MPAFLPLSFRLSERQRTHGEISHIVRLFLQCTLHAYTFQAFISYPGDFSTAHGFTRAPLEMTCCGAVAGRIYAACLKRSLPAGCPLCPIPRTSVIALHNLIPRPAIVVNNITMPRSGRRLCRAPFYYLKQIARARHPTLCWVMRIGAFAFAKHTKLSLASRKTVAFAR